MASWSRARPLSLTVGLGLLPLAATLQALAAQACDSGAPAQPALQSGADATQDDAAGSDAQPEGGAVSVPAPDTGTTVVYGLCPDAMAPTFPSILTQMFATPGCGTTSTFDCHSTSGALARSDGGTGSLLDFSLDAAAVYAELLGDGGGHPSVNIEGEAGAVPRVAPGDPDASLLYIKLAMPTASDPRYGLAMPPNILPCPAALEAVRAWIADGAVP
jgi:hypothetical protein